MKITTGGAICETKRLCRGHLMRGGGGGEEELRQMSCGPNTLQGLPFVYIVYIKKMFVESKSVLCDVNE